MGRLGPQVLEYLRGYALANEFLEAERRENLARMTPEESRAIFDQLCEIWDQSGSKAGGDLGALDELHLESHLRQRRAFELYAKARGLV
jgi:hypothetical protein